MHVYMHARKTQHIIVFVFTCTEGLFVSECVCTDDMTAMYVMFDHARVSHD